MEAPSPDTPPTDLRSAPADEFGTPRDGAGFDNRRINLVKLARAQRFLIFAVVAYFVTTMAASGMIWSRGRGVAAGTSFGAGDFVIIAAGIVVIVCAIRLALAYGMGMLLSTLLGVAMSVPWLGLLLLVVVNSYVDDVLRHAGVKVGMLGVGSEEMRKLRVGICRGCGYDLRGLPSPVCPECGKAARP